MKLARGLAAGTLALGFLGGGIWISGGAARVSALVRTAVSAPLIEPIPGSVASVPRDLVLDGSPSRTRRCTAPSGMSLASLRDHYEALADRESDLGNGTKLPHLSTDQGGVTLILWTSPADGHRKGVIAHAEAGIVRYTLIDGEPLGDSAPTRARPDRLYLPGGIVAPDGSKGSFTLEDGPQGYAFFESPGSSDTVARELRTSLDVASFHVDERAQEELDAAREAAPQAQGAPVVISFQGKDRKGYFVVSPARPGMSRVTLALR